MVKDENYSLSNECTVSIVVEWENVLLAGSSRAQSMLDSLIKQCNEMQSVIEIIIATNRNEFQLKNRPFALSSRIKWQVEKFAGHHYYELKNLGAEKTKGERIVFVDSDVIPAQNWLKELLLTFSMHNANVCCGTAFIEPEDFYNRTFALFWFFPLRINDQEIRKASHFFANNIAFNRVTFFDNQFPIKPEASRGACLTLAKQLAKKGISIWKNPRASVAHPPPQGFANFCLRALAQGRDRNLREVGLNKTILGSIFRVFKNMARSVFKILRDYKKVGLHPFSTPLSITLSICYYIMYFLGELGCALKISHVMKISI